MANDPPEPDHQTPSTWHHAATHAARTRRPKRSNPEGRRKLPELARRARMHACCWTPGPS
eukprot:1420514-Alexandrium_andersonii.AAC.1